jgi:hypothetical protein
MLKIKTTNIRSKAEHITTIFHPAKIIRENFQQLKRNGPLLKNHTPSSLI